MTITVVSLSVFGLLMALASWGCAEVNIRDSRNTKLFGRVPIALIGVINYVCIIALTATPQVMNALVYVTGLFTAYLVVRAVKTRLGCPFCYVVWAVNATLVYCIATGTKFNA